MAPVAVTIYFASLLWMTLAPAFSLYIGHRVLSLVSDLLFLWIWAVG